MTNKNYPLISYKSRHKKNNSAFCPCFRLGRWKVTIEYSYMRGDDDVVWRCDEHKNQITVEGEK